MCKPCQSQMQCTLGVNGVHVLPPILICPREAWTKIFKHYFLTFRCRKQIKSYNGITGLHCRWCHLTLHNRCASHVSPECTLGVNGVHVLPPISICPTVLDRQHSVAKEKHSQRSKKDKNCHEESSQVFRFFLMKIWYFVTKIVLTYSENKLF